MFLRVLTSAALLCSAAAAPAAAAEHPSTTVLDDSFRTLDLGPGRPWGWQSAAYAQCTSNPGHYKLDHLTTTALSTARGHLTITATPRADGRWNTGLLTTGDSCASGGTGAQIRTGGLLMAHVRLPAAGSGTWPGLWTWRDGHNELDVFEWHADFPGTIEFANHVLPPGSGALYSGPEIGAGRWLWVGARFGADSVVWYVGTDLDHLVRAYEDGLGVGGDFAAYPILNLAVDDGNFHTPPRGSRPATMEADRLVVMQPAPNWLP
ncbi:beta-glucanase [Kitasatospora sp. DSM 101779]|uniref:beta-glucanase n=1 Tax=Kitasatospora sp. DSM 101779 TaxID=2853165 RepID=UPI0021D82D6A|nr:beta-glucanase [Kitasatospora sp. DSM 101779]MCU7825133.1 beta-glucanase [Kitasatospora sp. DSM 101779]